MKPELVRLLTTSPQLFVRQQKEWIEVVVDWETTNKYAILSPTQEQVGFVAERGGGIGHWLKRLIFRSHRGFDIDVLGRAGERLLHLSREFFFFFSDLDVRSPEGERYGGVHRRFGIINKIYDLKDESGQVFARVKSPLWRLWTFPLLTPRGADFAETRSAIRKKWGGVLSEVFTDADTYMIDFATDEWTQAQRAVILATAISIDFDFFENNQGRGGLVDLIPGE